jgi:uncharacterized membrane protein YdjX (TVP38/TMEM64 family)
VLITIGWYLKQNDYLESDALILFLQKHEVAAPAFFILIHVLFAVFFIPCSPLPILSGFMWGQTYGMLYAMLGALCGSCFTFMIGRYVAANYVKDHLSSSAIMWALKQADKHGWKIVAFTQINPIFPASTLGYFYGGLTGISFKIYFFTTLVFMLPLTVAFVFMGQSMRDVLLFGDAEKILVPLSVMVISLSVLFVLKPAIKRLVEKSKGNQ